MNDGPEEGTLLGKTACPSEDCGSSDACAVYEADDGSQRAKCFSCGKFFPVWTGGLDGGPAAGGRKPREVDETPADPDLIPGVFRDLKARGITEETCRRFGYRIGRFKSQVCHIAEYREIGTGAVIAQKIRLADKTDMPFLGAKPARCMLFGQHLWRTGGDWIVVTEGEIDAMSVGQVFPTRPVVSVIRGADGAEKDLKQHLEFLESYKSIILCFDNDKAGRAAVARCAPLFTPGKVRVAEVPSG